MPLNHSVESYYNKYLLSTKEDSFSFDRKIFFSITNHTEK